MQEQDIVIPISNDGIEKPNSKSNFMKLSENKMNTSNKITKDQNSQFKNNYYNNYIPYQNQYQTEDITINNSNNLKNNKRQNVEVLNSLNDEEIKKIIHNKFIRKVYSLVLIQFGFTFAFVLLFQIKILKNFLFEHTLLYVILLAISCFVLIVSFIILLCKPEYLKTVPKNYIFLLLITVAETILLVYISILYSFHYVLAALVMIIGICFGVFLISLFKKIESKYIVCIIIIACILALIYGFLIAIFRNFYLDFLYCVLGALIFTLFLVYDTQKLKYPDNNGEYEFEIDDYIIAALTIYFDVIRLFIEILKLLGSLGGN